MKVLKIIKKMLVGLFLIIFFGFVIGMTVLVLNFNKYGVPQFGNKTIIILKEKAADYNQGDVLVIESRTLKQMQENDLIFTYKVGSNGAVSVNVGAVGKIHTEENAISYVNGETYSTKFVIGEAVKVYEKIGRYLSIVQSRWGFFFIILVPVFLIFVSQIYSLIIEIKYGDEDDDDEEKPKKKAKAEETKE